MLSKEEAVKILKGHWEVEEFTFHAEFHVPKNIKLRPGTKPFGYFRNLRNGNRKLIYPEIEGSESYNRRIGIKYLLKEGLEDGKSYQISVDVWDNITSGNPFNLRVLKFEEIRKKELLESRASIDKSASENTLEEEIKKIFKENLDQRSPFNLVNLANSVESLATDIYTENKRFIYELIQNADDAGNSENACLKITIKDDYVVLAHNGKPFSNRDIRGLCGVGIGTKRSDNTKTGYKGIGFKSVFGQPFGLVYVKSMETLFRFDKDEVNKVAWKKEWGKREEWEEYNQAKFTCPWQITPIVCRTTGNTRVDNLLDDEVYSVKTAIKVKDPETLLKDVDELLSDGRILLFLRRLKTVILEHDEGSLSIKVVVDKERNITSLLKNEENISSWYVRSWEHDIP
ncbi:MAG: hypothetical protein P8O83_00525, partial [Flavobacteriaceae bacterium]|nr:hypothetical protein [Flavobacteriaceae bacterium]